jgi:hypothetical protein
MLLQPDANLHGWDPPSLEIEINDFTAKAIIAAVEEQGYENEINGGSQLDSHANMNVFGKHCYVISSSGKYANVSAFSEEAGSMLKVPIVDAIIAYDCPFTNKTYILIARNVLHVPSMNHNLIVPFILREANLICNDTPKMQCNNPTSEDHCIIDRETGMKITLELDGIFSMFCTRMPTADDLYNCTPVVITPEGSTWDPYSNTYKMNEEAHTDTDGVLIEREYVRKELVDDDDFNNNEEEEVYDPFSDIDALNAIMNDPIFNSQSELWEEEAICASTIAESAPLMNEIEIPEWSGYSPDELDVEIHCNVAAFATAIHNADAESKFKMSIGSTTSRISSLNSEVDPLFIDGPTVIDLGLNLESAMKAEVNATAGRANGVSARDLAKVWSIDEETATRSLNITTQLKQQDADGSLSRNFSTNDRMLRYKRISTHFFTDTFFVTKKARSTRGHNCIQLFVSDKGFVYVVPMKSKGEFPYALKMFAKEIGVPPALIMDPAGEQTSNKVKKFAREISMTLRILEEHTQWANLAEKYIGLIKQAVRKDMLESDCPIVLWDYCVEWRARVNNMTAKDLFQLQSMNPHLATTGEEGDISNICVFKFYDWCYYWDQKPGFPLQKRRLGRILGPSKNDGNEMAQYVLKSNGSVVPRRTCQRLSIAETHHPDEIKKRQIFTECIRNKLGDSMTLSPVSNEKATFVPYSDDDEDPRIIPENDISALNISLVDALINAEVSLHQGEESTEAVQAKVLRHLVDEHGNVIGNANVNPILNTIMYEVEFPDGEVRPYAANVIADNIYSQVDNDGRRSFIFDSIIDYTKDAKYAVKKADNYIIVNGRRSCRRTTAGWKLLILMKDGSEQWIPLKDMKESNPVDVAEFAMARNLIDEPAFIWWVPYTLRKKDNIIAAIKSRVKVNTHKYGIEVPRNMIHAKELDAKNNNTLWIDAWKKEMSNVSIAFEFLPNGEAAPNGYSRSSGHLIWDLKMDFTRKARWVKDGHKTPDPNHSNYAGVVARDSVRIAFTYAALNDLDVMAADVQNAYLQAPSSEKHYIICGDEFGEEHRGKVAIIRRALYGGKSAGRDYWLHMRSCMGHLGFSSSKGDADIWMREAKKSNGDEYYEYVLLYVDDCLVISEHGESVIRNEIGKYFTLKESSIGPPDIYLGGKVRKVNLANGSTAWSFSSSQYVQAAVNNVEEHLKKKMQKIPPKANAPLKTDYRPEIDLSSELEPIDAAYYQSLIGILRWIVELGRVDICCEVSMMSSCLALPRIGHLQQLYYIFAYLKKHHNTEMVFDATEPDINMTDFEKKDWSNTVYVPGDGEIKEALPTDMPKPRGKGFVMRAYVDSDHAGDTVTRRSRTGYLIYLNSALICWHSKKQTSIETSSFGSEFMAMKHATEYIRGLRYKLRMMGIPVDMPTYIYGDNQSVLANVTGPDSVLKKKSNSIAYHFVREGCARDEWRTTYINTHDNQSDILTKPLPPGEKRSKFCRMLLHHLCAVD